MTQEFSDMLHLRTVPAPFWAKAAAWVLEECSGADSICRLLLHFDPPLNSLVCTARYKSGQSALVVCTRTEAPRSRRQKAGCTPSKGKRDKNSEVRCSRTEGKRPVNLGRDADEMFKCTESMLKPRHGGRAISKGSLDQSDHRNKAFDMSRLVLSRQFQLADNVGDLRVPIPVLALTIFSQSICKPAGAGRLNNWGAV